MRRWLGTILSPFVVATLLAGTGASADQTRGAELKTGADSAQTACIDVGGMNAQARDARRGFMRSDRAPTMMGRMMEMAHKVGDGDVMAGMTRMMDMMGSSGRGGMMGGQGGMMKPAPPSR